eukprot:TRINITY_DN61475_c0_g1_i1.p1 TRINITY_DN61475_c0_g1~~TRINITY_DN61475_c0_g1_i1.p1  ORF type:complete len:752 (-),score=65.05 TRINITY_DN61475_c0_g1_i1:122-2377(-)
MTMILTPQKQAPIGWGREDVNKLLLNDEKHRTAISETMENIEQRMRHGREHSKHSHRRYPAVSVIMEEQQELEANERQVLVCEETEDRTLLQIMLWRYIAILLEYGPVALGEYIQEVQERKSSGRKLPPFNPPKAQPPPRKEDYEQPVQQQQESSPPERKEDAPMSPLRLPIEPQRVEEQGRRNIVEEEELSWKRITAQWTLLWAHLAQRIDIEKDQEPESRARLVWEEDNGRHALLQECQLERSTIGDLRRRRRLNSVQATEEIMREEIERSQAKDYDDLVAALQEMMLPARVSVILVPLETQTRQDIIQLEAAERDRLANSMRIAGDVVTRLGKHKQSPPTTYFTPVPPPQPVVHQTTKLPNIERDREKEELERKLRAHEARERELMQQLQQEKEARQRELAEWAKQIQTQTQNDSLPTLQDATTSTTYPQYVPVQKPPPPLPQQQIYTPHHPQPDNTKTNASQQDSSLPKIHNIPTTSLMNPQPPPEPPQHLFKRETVTQQTRLYTGDAQQLQQPVVFQQPPEQLMFTQHLPSRPHSAVQYNSTISSRVSSASRARSASPYLPTPTFPIWENDFLRPEEWLQFQSVSIPLGMLLEIKKQFMELDTQGVGYLDLEAVGKWMEKVHLKKDKAGKLKTKEVYEGDKDKEATYEVEQSPTEQEMVENPLRYTTFEYLSSMIREVDMNFNGVVDWWEFFGIQTYLALKLQGTCSQRKWLLFCTMTEPQHQFMMSIMRSNAEWSSRMVGWAVWV